MSAVSDSDSADDASSSSLDDAASLNGIAVDDLEFMSGFLQQAIEYAAIDTLEGLSRGATSGTASCGLERLK